MPQLGSKDVSVANGGQLRWVTQEDYVCRGMNYSFWKFLYKDPQLFETGKKIQQGELIYDKHICFAKLCNLNSTILKTAVTVNIQGKKKYEV